MGTSEGLTVALTILVFYGTAFGGIIGIIHAVGRARADRIRAEAEARSVLAYGVGTAPDPLLTELRTFQQQVREMQSTNHEFNLSIDQALSRLESRVSRMEAKIAAGAAPADETQTLRQGHPQ